MGLIAVVVIILSVTILPMTIYANAYHEYTGTVIAIETVDFIYAVTEVTLMTYSDSQIVVSIHGFHEFEIGSTYTIITKGSPLAWAPELISVDEL